MKLTNEEHMDLIAERCRELLAIAEKRTQGEWDVYEHRAYHTSYLVRGGEKQNQLAQTFNWQDRGFDINSESNAQFIAACANNAEAGWRSTIAAIELMKLTGYTTGHAAAQIIAAWPIELLRK